MTRIPALSLHALQLALIALALWALVLIYSSITASSAQGAMQSWRDESRIPSTGEWQAAWDDIEKSLATDNSNTEHLEAAAQLSYWKAFLHPSDSQEHHTSLRDTIKRYRELTRRRPAWHGYWVGIIQAKYGLWEFDPEMQHALRQAAERGPWFPESQKTIIRAGMPGWPFLEMETREAVSQTLERALRLQPKDVIAMALDDGFIAQVLPAIEADENLLRLYRQALGAREQNLRKQEKHGRISTTPGQSMRDAVNARRTG